MSDIDSPETTRDNSPAASSSTTPQPPPELPYLTELSRITSNQTKKSRLVPPEKRKKIGRACDNCKKRKQKCTGLLPCSLCTTKGVSCQYTKIDRRVLKPSKKELELRKKILEERQKEGSALLRDDIHNSNPASDRLFTPDLEKKYPMGNAKTTSKFKAPLVRRDLMSTEAINNNNHQDQSHQHQHQHQHQNQHQHQHQHHQLDFPFANDSHNVTRTNEIQITRDQIPLSLQPLLSFPIVSHVGSEVDSGDDSEQNGKALGPLKKNRKRRQAGVLSTKAPTTSIQEPSADSDNDHDNDDNSFLPESPPSPKLLATTDVDDLLQYDQSGNLISVLGKISPASYLLLCQSVFEQALGHDNKFSKVAPMAFTESPGLVKNSGTPMIFPEKPYCDYLILLFSEHLNNTVYLISYEYLEEILQLVYSDVSNVAPRDLVVYYLMLAIGSLFAAIEIKSNIFPYPLSKHIDPVIFYETAVGILNNIKEEDDSWPVETHLLIFLFHHLSGWRSSAWVNLSTSIRHSLALGLNKTEVNDAFPLRYSNHRRKIFRTLYIFDRLWSTMFGRKLSISDSSYEDYDTVVKFTDYQTGLLITCKLLGRIVDKFHTANTSTISLKDALCLASDIKRQAAQVVPKLTENNYSILLDHRYFLPYICHLHGIVLLSRPFFYIFTMEKLGLIQYKDFNIEKNVNNMKVLKMFYQSCIKASLLQARMMQFIYIENVHPYKPMNLAHAAFQAGLVLGLLLLLNKKNIDYELFDEESQPNGSENENENETGSGSGSEEGDQYKGVDTTKMLENSLSSCMNIFECYAIFDDTSKKFCEALKALQEVTIGADSSANVHNMSGFGAMNEAFATQMESLNRVKKAIVAVTPVSSGTSPVTPEPQNKVPAVERFDAKEEAPYNKDFFTAMPMCLADVNLQTMLSSTESGLLNFQQLSNVQNNAVNYDPTSLPNYPSVQQYADGHQLNYNQFQMFQNLLSPQRMDSGPSSSSLTGHLQANSNSNINTNINNHRNAINAAETQEEKYENILKFQDWIFPNSSNFPQLSDPMYPDVKPHNEDMNKHQDASISINTNATTNAAGITDNSLFWGHNSNSFLQQQQQQQQQKQHHSLTTNQGGCNNNDDRNPINRNVDSAVGTNTNLDHLASIGLVALQDMPQIQGPEQCHCQAQGQGNHNEGDHW